MALVKCPECGAEISDKATACVKCGYPISYPTPSDPESSQGERATASVKDSGGDTPSSMSNDAAAILKSRLAKDEISLKEYKALLAELSVSAAPQPDPATNHSDFEEMNKSLLTGGYRMDEGANRVFQRYRHNGKETFTAIGTLDGWFLWGRAIGSLLLVLFAGGIVVSGVMWMFADPGTNSDVFMDDHPIFATLAFLTQVGVWGLFLWYQRARYMDYESTYDLMLKGLEQRRILEEG